jgi:hypothetical protein
MTTLLLSFAFMLLLVAGMAVGVLFGRKPITGSCGGMKALGMNMECEICGGDPDRCESTAPADSAERQRTALQLGHDATDRNRP